MDPKDRTRDEWIALRCQAGEPDACQALVALMERPLFCYAAKLTGSADAALDILQEVWLINRSHVQLLKEIKQLQLQVLEIQAQLQEP